MAASLHRDDQGIDRCSWCGTDPLYVRYHDTEWGQPLHGEASVFEKIVLEGMQAGLSWITILRKRENFRAAFRGFDVATVAGFGDHDVQRLLLDAGIVRNRAKIDAAISNARVVASMLDRGESLDALCWSFAPPRTARRRLEPGASIPPTSPESVAMSKELLRRGFRFVGPTTMYAFMQSAGMVDDHVVGCHVPEN